MIGRVWGGSWGGWGQAHQWGIICVLQIKFLVVFLSMITCEFKTKLEIAFTYKFQVI